MDQIEQLYRMYFQDVFLFLRAISKNEDLAEELTQETFFKALKSIRKFRGDCDIRVWLCQIAKNTYYSYCEKHKKIKLEEITDTMVDETVSLEKEILNREQTEVLKKLLQEMQKPYQQVFYLRVFAELSFRKIGESFGKTENWARVTYYRAKSKLAKEMEDKYGKNEL